MIHVHEHCSLRAVHVRRYKQPVKEFITNILGKYWKECKKTIHTFAS